MLDMKRRQFITLLGGAAAWPLAARAQQFVNLKPDVLFAARATAIAVGIGSVPESISPLPAASACRR